MSESPDHAADLTDAERAWPYAAWKLYVGRLLEIGDGLRIGLVEVPDDTTASVRVLSPAAPQDAELVTLELGTPVPCDSRTVRLVEVDRSGPRPWIHVLVS